jgi:predicted nucleic-acid-binding Zn-ribbon protein
MTASENIGMTCTQCKFEELDEGFIEDTGQGTQGFARWIGGPLERGLFGGAKRLGRRRWKIAAFRCRQCGHLELYAREAI